MSDLCCEQQKLLINLRKKKQNLLYEIQVRVKTKKRKHQKHLWPFNQRIKLTKKYLTWKWLAKRNQRSFLPQKNFFPTKFQKLLWNNIEIESGKNKIFDSQFEKNNNIILANQRWTLWSGGWDGIHGFQPGRSSIFEQGKAIIDRKKKV